MKPSVTIALVAATILADPLPAAEPFTLWNGTFTEGSNTPAQWTKEGDATIARDTMIFKTGPAALRTEVSSGKGNAEQSYALPGTRKFKLSGYIKTEGDAKAQVVVMPLDEKITMNQWKQIVYCQGTTDWRHFQKDVELPEWTGSFRVMLNLEGTGKAWLDDLAIDDSAPAEAKPGAAAAELAEASRPRDPAKDEPADGKPWEPAWCTWGWRSAWVAQHKGFLESARNGEGDIVFLGDSITLGWEKRWENTFAPLKAVNLGIGGDSTRQLLWRLQNGEMDGRKPKLVVLMIGTNNLYGDKNKGTDEEIAKGIGAVLSLIREKAPDARILLCAILPRQNEYFSTRIKKINEQTNMLANGKTIHWLDMRDTFMLTEPGTMKPELFTESGDSALHPNKAGYDAMTLVMKPVIEKLLK